jgi:uncharacterized alkaline shock family protein YloU
MNLIKRFFILAFAIIMILSGLFLVLTGVSVIFPSEYIDAVLNFALSDITGQFILIGFGLFVILLGITAPYRLEKKLKKKRIVAFQNPDGEVSVSLSAVEDYIQKIAKSVPGIKDVKSKVSIDKKGIDITTAVSVVSGMNIPEMTEHIQLEVKNKVQTMLGVEENIRMKIHISKIIRSAVPEESTVPEEEAPMPGVPYRENQ